MDVLYITKWSVATSNLNLKGVFWLTSCRVCEDQLLLWCLSAYYRLIYGKHLVCSWICLKALHSLTAINSQIYQFDYRFIHANVTTIIFNYMCGVDDSCCLPCVLINNADKRLMGDIHELCMRNLQFDRPSINRLPLDVTVQSSIFHCCCWQHRPLRYNRPHDVSLIPFVSRQTSLVCRITITAGTNKCVLYPKDLLKLFLFPFDKR